MTEAPGDSGGVAPSTSDRLLEAAGEVFAEQGYDGVRVQDIARRAGLTTGAIYANFRNKAGLLLQAINSLSSTYLAGALAERQPDAGEVRGARYLTEVTARAIDRGNSKAR